jgi:hypothetical protein
MLERTVKEISTVKVPTPAIRDEGLVRLGLVSPTFPPVKTTRSEIADSGKVRIGLVSPSFPRARVE